MARYVNQLRQHALGRFPPLRGRRAGPRGTALPRRRREPQGDARPLPCASPAGAVHRWPWRGRRTRRPRQYARAVGCDRALEPVPVPRPRALLRRGEGGPGCFRQLDRGRRRAACLGPPRHGGRDLARLVYRGFVSEADEPPDALLGPLADTFSCDGDIGRLVETVLRSNLFFSERAYRCKIKSPVELAPGMIVGLEGLIPTAPWRAIWPRWGRTWPTHRPRPAGKEGLPG